MQNIYEGNDKDDYKEEENENEEEKVVDHDDPPPKKEMLFPGPASLGRPLIVEITRS